MLSTRRRRAAAWAIIAALTMCLILATVYTILRTGAVVDAVREQQMESIRRGKDIKALAVTINDCTDPQGKCFQRGQRRTAQAVNGINAATLRVISAALSCQADGFTERIALANCTAERASRRP